MTLESRPQLRYARIDMDRSPADLVVAASLPPEETLVKALELARQLEELLEDTRSVGALGSSARDPRGVDEARAHSTRMARAMAASLVDELEALVRPSRTSGVA